MDSATGLQVVSSPSLGTSLSTILSDQEASTSSLAALAPTSAGDRADQLLLASIGGTDAATLSLNVGDQYKSLSISAQEIISKLNEILKGKLPNGIESLSPEDVTPEKTASTIVQGITALYSNYVKSNPELSPEEALTRFMAAARKGVDDGYSSATDTLDSLGAFQISGVQDGIAETKKLIEQKLKEFEDTQRATFTATDAGVSSQVESEVTISVLTQAGYSTYSSSLKGSGNGTVSLFV